MTDRAGALAGPFDAAHLGGTRSVDTATRRDDCGDPIIFGTSGRIYAVPSGFQVIVETESPRAWSAARKRLSFARLLRDGNTEGALHLDTLPDAEQAAVIRSTLGIRKHRMVAVTVSKPDLVAIPQWQAIAVQMT